MYILKGYQKVHIWCEILNGSSKLMTVQWVARRNGQLLSSSTSPAVHLSSSYDPGRSVDQFSLFILCWKNTWQNRFDLKGFVGHLSCLWNSCIVKSEFLTLHLVVKWDEQNTRIKVLWLIQDWGTIHSSIPVPIPPTPLRLDRTPVLERQQLPDVLPYRKETMLDFCPVCDTGLSPAVGPVRLHRQHSLSPPVL